MREIEFRGKRLKDNKWIHGFYHNETSIVSPATNRKRTAHHIYRQDIDALVKPETVGQYTGVKDKNGRKIFEGDIVTYNIQNDKHRSEVYYYDGGFCIKNSTIEGLCLVQHYQDMEVEVIGNIHDNPQLLEEY